MLGERLDLWSWIFKGVAGETRRMLKLDAPHYATIIIHIMNVNDKKAHTASGSGHKGLKLKFSNTFRA